MYIYATYTYVQLPINRNRAYLQEKPVEGMNCKALIHEQQNSAKSHVC